ncbi:MAG: hypothetical protein WA005_03635 [Candidatus Binataceae bacterium]
MSDDGVARMGMMLEQLGSRFELVIEALSGINGQIDGLRGEMVAQFVEVGKQIRFLSEEIGENRENLRSLRAELSGEMVRLGEALGATRVEFRKQLADTHVALRDELAGKLEQSAAGLREEISEKIEKSDGGRGIVDKLEHGTADLHAQIEESARITRAELREQIVESRNHLRHEIAQTRDKLRIEIAEIRGGLHKEIEQSARGLSAELKQTSKSLVALGRKFERFDDRTTVQVRDHEQRLRKLARGER